MFFVWFLSIIWLVFHFETTKTGLNVQATQADDKPVNEWGQGWPIVLSSLVGIALCLSPLPFYTLIVLAPELAKEFHWTRAQVTGGFMFMTLGVLIGAPIVGLLSDRLGTRRVLLPSIVFLGLLMASFSVMNGSIWMFYGIFLLMSILGAGTLPITWSKAIVNNFDGSRGLALGVALTGTGLFGFFAPPYTQWLIDAYGWRVAYIGIGLLPIALSFPLAYILYHDPKDVKVNPKTHKSSTQLPGLNFAEVLVNYRFYLMLISFLILGAMVSGILGNAKFILMDKGYSAQMAASFFRGAGLIGLSVLVGRLIGGVAVDYIWAPAVAFVFMAAPAISCLIFMQPDSSVALNSLALILTGLAAGVEYDLMAYLVSRYFGMKSYSKIYAFIYVAFAIGSGGSPAIYNKIYQSSGSYTPILKLAAIGFLSAAALLLLLGKYEKFNDGPSDPL